MPVSHQELIAELFQQYDELALPRFQNTLAKAKADGTAVTEVDQAASELVSNALKRATPDYGIISEEEAIPFQPEAPWQWVIDPLDGTASFARGYPVWGLGIGLLHQDQAVEGYLRFPVLNESYACDDRGFTLNGRPVPRPEATALEDTRNYLLDSSLHKRFETFGPFRSHKIRVFGSNLYHMAAVAVGRAEAMVCGRMKIWDLAAAMPMIQAQGMEARYVDGAPLALSSLVLEQGYRAREPLVIGPPDEVARLVEGLGESGGTPRSPDYDDLQK